MLHIRVYVCLSRRLLTCRDRRQKNLAGSVDGGGEDGWR